LYNPTNLGLDLPDNLAFFVENDAYADGTVYAEGTGRVELEVGTLTRYNFADLQQIGDFATGFEINTGLAIDTVNQEIYYSIENYYTPSENGIYSVRDTLSGSLATVGTVTTLYSGAAAGDPESIAIDPVNGLLYVSGEVPLGSGSTGAAWVGSLSGSAEAPLTQIFQLSADTSNSTATFADTAIFEASPSISAGGTVIFSPGDTPVTLDPAVTIADESEPDLAGATVSIGGGFLLGDTLKFTDQDGITGTCDPTSGLLTFSGTASVGDYQAELGAVTYSYSGDPTDGGTDTGRSISWSVLDGVETSGVSDSSVTTLCFLAGTLIATPGGEVPVERLTAGDTVLTARGEARPVAWIGVGRVLANRGRRTAATPVIVHKGALEDNMPHHDLRITKGHSLYLDGALIPVEFLVNHRSIVWDGRAQEVEIYHVELETHDVPLANGAPAESYCDDGNRWLFRNANSLWAPPPKQPCAPVLTGGAIVDQVWRRLLDRSGPRPRLPLTDDPDPHLLVDGRRVDPAPGDGTTYSFCLPP
jgi:Hint domain